MTLLDARRARIALALVVAIAGCGGAPAAREETTPEARPVAPERSGNDQGLAATQRFVDALRAYAGPEGPIDPVLVEQVAWRVYVTSILGFALEGLAPGEHETFAVQWSDELSRAGTEELARAYAAEWQEHVRGGDCVVRPGAIPEEPLFPRTDRVVPALRARVEAELARTSELRAVYEVHCGEQGFRVGVLGSAPALVPML